MIRIFYGTQGDYLGQLHTRGKELLWEMSGGNCARNRKSMARATNLLISKRISPKPRKLIKNFVKN